MAHRSAQNLSNVKNLTRSRGIDNTGFNVLRATCCAESNRLDDADPSTVKRKPGA